MATLRVPLLPCLLLGHLHRGESRSQAVPHGFSLTSFIFLFNSQNFWYSLDVHFLLFTDFCERAKGRVLAHSQTCPRAEPGVGAEPGGDPSEAPGLFLGQVFGAQDAACGGLALRPAGGCATRWADGREREGKGAEPALDEACGSRLPHRPGPRLCCPVLPAQETAAHPVCSMFCFHLLFFPDITSLAAGRARGPRVHSPCWAEAWG